MSAANMGCPPGKTPIRDGVDTYFCFHDYFPDKPECAAGEFAKLDFRESTWSCEPHPLAAAPAPLPGPADTRGTVAPGAPVTAAPGAPGSTVATTATTAGDQVVIFGSAGMYGITVLALLVALAAVAVAVLLHRDRRAAAWLRVLARGSGRILRPPLRWAWHVGKERKYRRRALRFAVLFVGTVTSWRLAANLLPFGELLAPLLLLLLVLVLGGGLALLRRAPAAPAVEHWWSERPLLAALRAAGVLTPAKADTPPTVLRRYGAPRHDEHGTAVTFGLPGARPWTEALARRDRLAAAMGCPVRLLVVSHDEDQAANVVTIWRGTVQPSGTVAAGVGWLARTSWHTAPRIGRTLQGRPVHLPTDEANTLISGVMGYGKTSAARILVGHALLDPAARVWIVDGKGSTKDWGAASSCAEALVLGTEDDAAAQVEAVLAEVLAAVQDRNATSAHRAAEDRPGALLLVLDEWQDVRAGADKGARERLDTALGRVIRLGRAAGAHVLVVTQRPTVEDVPSGSRNLLSSRLALVTRNAADAALVLGETPTLPLPTARGEALLATPAGTVAVRLDLLDEAAWSALCARAEALRGPRAAPAPAASDEPPEPPFDDAPEPERDPLVEAVLAVLTDADPRGLPATSLLAALPPLLAPASPAVLGRALAGCPELERGHVGKRPVWRLRSTLGHPSAQPRSTEGAEATEGAVHARSAPSAGGRTAENRHPGADPSEPSAPSAAA